uniref:Uncharacterized protein n=1 Tax=Arundo donax TaxID=35708 RepID=A0A0A9B9B4_ARUDO
MAKTRMLRRHLGVCDLEALVHALVVRAWHPCRLGGHAVVITKLTSVGYQGACHIHCDQPQLG